MRRIIKLLRKFGVIGVVMNRKILLLSLLLLLSLVGHSQRERGGDTLEQRLEAAKSDSQKLRTLFDIVYRYQITDVKKSLAYAQQGLALALKDKKNKTACDFLGYMAEDYSFLGNYDAVATPANQEYELARQSKDWRHMALARHSLGLAAECQGNYLDAQRYNFDCLKIAEEHRDTFLIMAADGNIGVVYTMQQNVPKAIEYSQKVLSLDSLRHAVGRDIVAKALEVIGVSYNREQHPDTARTYLLRALDIYRHEGSQMGIATMYTQLSQTYAAGDPACLDYAQKAQAIWNNVGPDGMESLYNLANIGTIYYQLARYYSPADWNYLTHDKNRLLTLADTTLSRALSLARSTHSEHMVMEFGDSLAQVKAYRGKYQQAFDLLQEHNVLNDTIYSQDTKNKIAGIEKQHDIELRDKQLQINQLELSNQRKIRWLLICGLTLLLLAVIIIAWQSRLRKKANVQLTEANRELDAAGKLKTQFFGILNHDLRRPIGNFINLLYLVQNKPDLLAGTHTRRITTAAEGLLETMDDLLLWTKGQMEHFTPAMTDVPVSRLFSQLEKMFPFTTGVSIDYRQPSGMVVHTDEDYCQTMLRNLTNNALTALSGMPLGAHIQWTAWEEDGKKYLSIADNGPGASSAQLQALFDETLPVGIRNGLGLHVVRDMAKAIGCTVSARPVEGGGLEVVLIM